MIEYLSHLHMAIAAALFALAAFFAAGFAYAVITLYELATSAWARRKAATTSPGGDSLDEQHLSKQRAAHR